MVLKIPPPPQFSGAQWQSFNRWLIELQSILNGAGDIDATAVTQPPGDNSTNVATTAFVLANGGGIPSTTVPLMDATPGEAGTSTAYARGDHQHPTDATRAAATSILRLPNPTNLFVSTTGSDANNGLTTGTAFLTLQHAINVAMEVYDFQGSTITINVGAGSFAGGQVNGSPPGTGLLSILGAGSTNTTFTSTIVANSSANLKIGAATITVSSGPDILAENYSAVQYGSDLTLGSAVTALVQCSVVSTFQGSNAINLNIAGSASAAFLAATGSNVQLSANAVHTVTGVPAFPNGFVNAIDGSSFNPGINSVFSGSSTGPTYNIDLNSYVDMEQNVNPLPGSTAPFIGRNCSYNGVPTVNILSTGNNTLQINNDAIITAASSGVALWIAGLLTDAPPGEIPGTATNDNASAGNVGEYVSSAVLIASSVPLTNNVTADITSINLTAGDWDVEGNIQMNNAGAPTVTTLLGWVNSSSVTLPPLLGAEGGFVQWRGSTTANVGEATGLRRFSLAATATIFLSCQSDFSGGTNAKAYGLIRARRVR